MLIPLYLHVNNFIDMLRTRFVFRGGAARVSRRQQEAAKGGARDGGTPVLKASPGAVLSPGLPRKVKVQGRHDVQRGHR